MNRPQMSRNYIEQDPAMYDDQPTRDREDSRYSYHRGSSGYEGSSWQDRRTPPRGPAAGMRNDSHYSERERRARDDGYENERGRRRSRSPQHYDRRGYNDRDREGYKSRSRSRSPYYGAPPHHTVILESIPVDMTQEDKFGVGAVEEIRIIKNKVIGSTRQLAFVQFPGIPEAKAFLERHYPAIYMSGSSKNDTAEVQVRIAFSREKVERPPPGKTEGDWKCTSCYNMNYSHRILCFRCSTPKPKPTLTIAGGIPQNVSTYSGFVTTGDSDVSPDNTPSQFLLLRGLEPSVNEELVAKGVTKLYKSDATPPPTTDPRLPKRLKASTAKRDTNVGATEGSLQRVLLVRDRKTEESWKYAFAEFFTVDDAQAAMAKYKVSEKFTIASKPVMISYIHAGVFVPASDQFIADPANAKFSISPLHNPSIKLMYWDQAGYVKELITAEKAPSKESTNAKLPAAAAKEGLVSSTKDADSKTKKRKAEKETSGSNKKVVAPHLQFWTNRHAEIHGLPSTDSEEGDEAAAASAVTKAAEEAPPSRSYADMIRKCCLLCSRQFKTDAEVHKHERMSELHRNNMKDEAKVKVAIAKLAKVSAKETEDESAYRDRAKERRQAFNQPRQAAPQQHNKVKEKAIVEEEPVPTVSRGAALLEKMGWTAGEGLGAQGTGMTTAIQTDLYSQGVGLGAEGGKIGDAVEEAQRNTKGTYQDFIDKTKDRAKERYEAMN